jgi:hypothetical protein
MRHSLCLEKWMSLLPVVVVEGVVAPMPVENELNDE